MIQIRATSIERAWKELDSNDVWILVKDSGVSFEGLGSAVDDANERSLSVSSVMGEMPTTSPAGHVVMLSGVVNRESLHAWLEMFAEALPRRGARGTVTSAPNARRPDWITLSPPVATAFVAWTIDLEAMTRDPGRDGHWLVPEDATTNICSAVSDWARKAAGTTMFLRQNIYTLKLRKTDVAAPLVSSVTATGMAGVEVLHDDHDRAHHASLDPGGEGTFQVIGEPSWHEQVATSRDALLAVPEHIRYACIRTALPYALGLGSLDNVAPLPGIRESDLRYNKHLLGQYIPDAHGVQVLNERHLHKVNDLSRWNLTDLGHSRFLVEAADLEPWYSKNSPNARVLEQARQDFGPILLTRAVIADHPAPWL